MHKNSNKPLLNVPTPPTLQSIPPGYNFQETGRFNVLWFKQSPGFSLQTVVTVCSSGLLY